MTPETIFAVPSKSLLLITEEKANEILEEFKNTPPMTKKERKELKKKVRAMYTKPGDANGSLLL